MAHWGCDPEPFDETQDILRDRSLREILLSAAAQKQNAQLPPYSLDSSIRGNDEDDTPVIPGKAATRNPGGENWIPACAGMTDKDAPLVSALLLSTARDGELSMTGGTQWVPV